MEMQGLEVSKRRKISYFAKLVEFALYPSHWYVSISERGRFFVSYLKLVHFFVNLSYIVWVSATFIGLEISKRRKICYWSGKVNHQFNINFLRNSYSTGKTISERGRFVFPTKSKYIFLSTLYDPLSLSE